MKLYATGELVNGHEWVNADPGDPFWRGKGYVPEEELPVAEDLSKLSKAELEERAIALGIDLDSIEGSGKNGYVKAEDIVRAIEAAEG